MALVTRYSAASRRGFTLVEVLVSLTLMGVLLAAVLGSVLFMAKSQAGFAAKVETSALSRTALERIADDVRQMSSVTIGANGFTGTVPDAAGTGTQSLGYTYNASLGTLTRTSNGSSRIILNRLQSCLFTYYGAGTMDTAQSPARMGRGGALAVGTSTKVKQIQVSFVIISASQLTSSAQQVVSAQFTVRS